MRTCSSQSRPGVVGGDLATERWWGGARPWPRCGRRSGGVRWLIPTVAVRDTPSTSARPRRTGPGRDRGQAAAQRPGEMAGGAGVQEQQALVQEPTHGRAVHPRDWDVTVLRTSSRSAHSGSPVIVEDAVTTSIDRPSGQASAAGRKLGPATERFATKCGWSARSMASRPPARCSTGPTPTTGALLVVSSSHTLRIRKLHESGFHER